VTFGSIFALLLKDFINLTLLGVVTTIQLVITLPRVVVELEQPLNVLRVVEKRRVNHPLRLVQHVNELVCVVGPEFRGVLVFVPPEPA